MRIIQEASHVPGASQYSCRIGKKWHPNIHSARRNQEERSLQRRTHPGAEKESDLFEHFAEFANQDLEVKVKYASQESIGTLPEK